MSLCKKQKAYSSYCIHWCDFSTSAAVVSFVTMSAFFVPSLTWANSGMYLAEFSEICVVLYIFPTPLPPGLPTIFSVLRPNAA